MNCAIHCDTDNLPFMYFKYITDCEMNICKSTYISIINTIGTLPPEKGGIIGGSDHQVYAFFYDEAAFTNTKTYYPSENVINNILDKWDNEDVKFLGVIHSHRCGLSNLSQQDIIFARAIIASNPDHFKQVYFPIVMSSFDSRHSEILPYVISLSDVWLEQLNII